MKTLSKDVKYLVETGKMWKAKDLNERIGISCNDPALPTGAMRDACGYMIQAHGKAIAAEVEEHWTEESDKFEEDLVPDEFCKSVGACKEGQQTLSQIMAESSRKDKIEKEAKADKEASMKLAKEALREGGAGDLVKELNKEDKMRKKKQAKLDKTIHDRAQAHGADPKDMLKMDKEEGFKKAKERMRSGAAEGILNQMQQDVPDVLKKTAAKKESMAASHTEL
ncbi:unnamed protein product [Prorocentrum cordatum]|uniref:Uncharacterized protein n=1 Tax=Prorocentrum cordatum TaxID=2364126 RepID=A0ABN9T5G5_9DINO|nr:unnamed protein product [Polarella glacialis]